MRYADYKEELERMDREIGEIARARPSELHSVTWVATASRILLVLLLQPSDRLVDRFHLGFQPELSRGTQLKLSLHAPH